MQFTVKHNALMYGFFAKHILSSGLPDSFDILAEVTKRCAVERGIRMAKAAHAAGDETDMAAFIAYSEWKPAQVEDYEAEMLAEFPVYSLQVASCDWYNVWKEYDLTEYCKTYCRVFEEAVALGFNPLLDFRVPRSLLEGHSGCVFIYNGLAFNFATLKRIEALEKKRGGKNIYSWEYHTAHFYCTISRELIKRLGHERADTIIKQVLVSFGEEFSAEAVKTVTAYQNVDFKDPSHPKLLMYV